MQSWLEHHQSSTELGFCSLGINSCLKISVKNKRICLSSDTYSDCL